VPQRTFPPKQSGDGCGFLCVERLSSAGEFNDCDENKFRGDTTMIDRVADADIPLRESHAYSRRQLEKHTQARKDKMSNELRRNADTYLDEGKLAQVRQSYMYAVKLTENKQSWLKE